jgi:hypothetical protein
MPIIQINKTVQFLGSHDFALAPALSPTGVGTWFFLKQ